MSSIVFYHAHCVDGFTAAWCMWKELGDDAEYVAVKYRDPLPSTESVQGKDVYIVDFSWPPDELREAWGDAPAAVLILDHHKTMAERYSDWGEQSLVEEHGFERTVGSWRVKYRSDQSGAKMAEVWAGMEPTELVKYVQDRDLWQWKLSDSKEVSAYIASIQQGFKTWNTLEMRLNREDYKRSLIERGSTIITTEARMVKQMAAHAYRDVVSGHKVMMCNAPILQSELGAYLSERNPDRIALIWSIQVDGRTRVSLRSVGDVDCTVLAKMYKGGGHKNAAGFITYERF